MNVSNIVLRFDSPGSKVNSLGEETSAELQEAFHKFINDPSAKSAVLMSGKPGCFIAGADINMLASCKTAEEATALSKGCQDLLFEVEKCKKPVVAAIQGSCLGGGLEVAMACHYRIAVDGMKTGMGVPEVSLNCTHEIFLNYISGTSGCSTWRWWNSETTSPHRYS